MSLSELSNLKMIDGQPLDCGIFSDKVVFAVNVASACHTSTKPGYDLLKRLLDKYSSGDFVAVAIPCNSFGWMENGSPEEIRSFALSKASRLVVTERSLVNGSHPHPIVALGKTKFPGRVMWNFDGRYLFNRSGQPCARFSNSSTSEEIEAAINQLI